MKCLHEMMFNSTNYQGNANQNHNETYFKSIKMATIETKPHINKITSVGQDVNKLKLLCTHSGNVKWCSHYNSLEVLQKIMIQQFQFWVYTRNNLKPYLNYILVHPCSQQHYSQLSKGGSNPSVHQDKNEQRKGDVYIQQNVCLKKEGNSDTCRDMIEPRIPYAE